MSANDTEKSRRKRRRLIGGAGVLVIGPVVFFLSCEPGVDRTMLWMLVGWLVTSVFIFASSFGMAADDTKKEEEA